MKILMKKSLSILLTVMMVISVMPLTMISFANEVSVDYINENGVTATQTATELTGAETVLDAGWYVVNGNVSFDHDLSGSGVVNVILADGCYLEFSGTTQLYLTGTGGTLNMFAQSEKTGTFSGTSVGAIASVNIYAGNYNAVNLGGGEVNVYGGMFNLSSGIYSIGDINISGGEIYATGDGNVIYSGFLNNDGGNITLGCSSLDDCIMAGEYNAHNGTVVIADGQTLHDGNGGFYSGTLTSGEISAIASKPLRLAQFATVTWKNADGTVLETDTDVLCAFDTPEYNGQTPTMSEDANYSYAFRGWSTAIQPIEGDTVYTADYSKVKKNVSYIDANGDTQTVNATVLDGSEATEYYDYSSTLFVGEEGATSWYVVEDDVVYSGMPYPTMRIKGDVNLIIEDGASLATRDIKTPYNDYARTLSIYGQTEGTGELNVDAFIRYYQFDTLNIYGATVNTGNISGIGTVNILSGTVNVTGNLSADYITFGCRTFNDSITINSIDLKSYTVTASVVSGHSLVDTNRNYYTGDLNYQQISDISGVTLTLHDEHAYSAPQWQWNGTSSSNWNAEATFRCSVCDHFETVSAGQVTRTVIQKANYTQNWIRRVTKTVTFNGETYQAHKDDERGLFNYEEINGVVAITGFRGYNGTYADPVITELTVPDVVPDCCPDESLRGRPIEVIAASAFEHERATPSVSAKYRLKKLTLGNNVTTIEDGAFENCAQLTEVTIGTGLTSIGANAFKDCDKLTKLTCNSLNTISCNQNSVPSGVAFYGPHAGGIKAVAIETNNFFYGTDSHSFIEPVWMWEEDFSATVMLACMDCDEMNMLDATVTSEITTEPGCSSEGVRTYTASVTYDETEFTDQTTEPVPATGIHTPTHHAYKAQTDLNYGNIEYWTCAVCGKYFSDENCENEITKEDTRINPNFRILAYGEIYEVGEPVVLRAGDCFYFGDLHSGCYISMNYNRSVSTYYQANPDNNEYVIRGSFVNGATNAVFTYIRPDLNQNHPFTGLYQCFRYCDYDNLFVYAPAIRALYYDISYTPEWNWSSDYSSATITLRHFNVGSYDGEAVEYEQVIDAAVTYTDDIANGKRTYTAAVDGYTMNFTDSITLDVTYNALTFNANGGTGSMDSMYFVDGDRYTLPDNGFTAPTHKYFTGWRINGADYIPGDEITISGITVVEAQWADKADLIFNGNGALGETATISVVPGTSVALPENGFTAPEHKYFAGWLIDETTYLPGDEYTLDYNTEAVAQWGELVDVTFDANGAPGSMASVSVAPGTAYTLPANGFDEYAKYTFSGWKIGETDYNAGATVTINEDTVIQARWTHVPCSVIWKDYDGTVLETDAEVPYGTLPIYNGATPTRANDTAGEIIYVFAGWNPEVSETLDDTVYTAVYNELPYIHYVDAQGNPLTLDVAYSIVTADTKAMTNGWWVVSGTATNANRIETGSDVNLILLDGATLTSSSGIHVSKNKHFTIWGQENGTGKLKVTGASANGAGIGGNIRGHSGYITINGGTVSAKGGTYGAGIGGGQQGFAQKITINGGTVSSNGGAGGAAIGGGGWGGAVVEINGGTVTANGGQQAAGIGGGCRNFSYGDLGKNVTVTINGGIITAKPGNYAAAIGAGDANSSGTTTVNINGGKIIANGAAGNYGIGLSANCKGGTVNINWTAETKDTMSIKAVSYRGTVNFVNSFSDENGVIFRSGKLPKLSLLAGKTITPYSSLLYDINEDGVENFDDVAFIVAASAGETTMSATQIINADFDFDDNADGFDAAWLDRYFYSPTLTDGDVDCDGDIDLTDYALVKAYISGEDLDTEHPSDLLDKSYLPAEYDLIKANFDDGVIITPAFYAADYNGDKAVDAFDLFSLDKRLNNIT